MPAATRPSATDSTTPGTSVTREVLPLRRQNDTTGGSSSSRANRSGIRLWFQASYIYSSLRGNYDGGVNEGVYGQTSPSINLDFDYPAYWHNGYGTLALDRTNRFRFDGYWVTPWRLSVGLQAFAETGAPLNQMGYYNFLGSDVFLIPRGSAGRLPTLWGANLTMEYPFAIGPVTVTLQGSLFNIFNKQIAVDRDNIWSSSPPAGYPATHIRPEPGADGSVLMVRSPSDRASGAGTRVVRRRAQGRFVRSRRVQGAVLSSGLRAARSGSEADSSSGGSRRR